MLDRAVLAGGGASLLPFFFLLLDMGLNPNAVPDIGIPTGYDI